MNYREFSDGVRTQLANFLNVHTVNAENPVQAEDIFVLWTDGMLELQRGLCWYGDNLYMVSYNSLTDAWTIDTYTKNA